MSGLEERRAYQAQERAAIAAAAPDLHEVLLEEGRCVGCGCSDSLACPDGCGWAAASLCSVCAADPEVAIELVGRLWMADQALYGVAVYAARVLTETDGLWPPAARATECRTGLQHIEAECRRVHETVTEIEEAQTT